MVFVQLIMNRVNHLYKNKSDAHACKTLLPGCQEILFQQHLYKRELSEVWCLPETFLKKHFVSILDIVLLSHMVVGRLQVPFRDLRFFRLF